jgi:arylsulfatase A
MIIVVILGLCLRGLIAQATERPNIILIMADDMGRETVGAHGGLDYKTPVLP